MKMDSGDVMSGSGGKSKVAWKLLVKMRVHRRLKASGKGTILCIHVADQGSIWSYVSIRKNDIDVDGFVRKYKRWHSFQQTMDSIGWLEQDCLFGPLFAQRTIWHPGIT